MSKYLLRTGVSYLVDGVEVDRSTGDVVDDLPRGAVRNLLAEGAVEKISDKQAEEMLAGQEADAKALAAMPKSAKGRQSKPTRTTLDAPRDSKPKAKKGKRSGAVAIRADHDPLPDKLAKRSGIKVRRRGGDADMLADRDHAIASQAATGQHPQNEEGEIVTAAEAAAEEAGVTIGQEGGPTTALDPAPTGDGPGPFDPNGHGDGLEGSEA